MMQTGPAVTLQVEKFGASYHGLGSLLSEPSSVQTTGRHNKLSLGVVGGWLFIFFMTSLAVSLSRG